MERIIREFVNEPVLKVNVANCDSFVDFKWSGPFSVLQGEEPVMQNVVSGLKWRVKLESSEPAQFIYALLVGTWKYASEAEAQVDAMTKLGYESRIQALGGIIRLNGEKIADNTHYRVLVGEFNSESDAGRFGWRLIDEYDAEVVSEKIRESRGLFEIFDEEYERSAKISNELSLIPAQPRSEMILLDPVNGNNNDDTRRSEKTYPWPMLFRVGDEGRLMLVGEIPLETYLKGVLPSEMWPDYPEEALKGQAVASRSFALANIGLSHPDAVFDICSESHCQLFNGTLRYHPRTDKAVKDTRGEVLLFNHLLCETPYSPLCGGYTNGQHLFWIQEKKRPDTIIFDGSEANRKKRSLAKESGVIDWVISQPEVYCNPEGVIADTASNDLKSGFRWEVTYPRKRLETIIQEKSGEDIGTLYDIIPLKRSPSGRLQEIELIGSRKNLKIRREIPIRRMLSDRLLKSSCFVIETDVGDDGIPLAFTFLGAGQGHGSGMCQAGAVALALDGKKYHEILTHYYKNLEMSKIYG